MHNLEIIEGKRTIHADFSADQWGLYTNSISRNVIEAVATRFNDHLNEYVNGGYTKAQTLEGMHDIMSTYREFGAYDTEPRAFLDVVLEEIYK